MGLVVEARDAALDIVERTTIIDGQASTLSSSCNALLAMLEPLVARADLITLVGPQLQLLVDDLKTAQQATGAQQDRDQRLAESAYGLQHRFETLMQLVGGVIEADDASKALEVLRTVGIEVQSDREQKALQKMYINPATLGEVSDDSLIGEGGCSDVHEVWDNVRQEQVAIKVFRLRCSTGITASTDDKKQAFHQELLTMLDAKLLNLPQVCKYYGFTVLPSNTDAIKRFGLVMKLYKGTLEGVLPRDGGGLPLPQVLRYSASILKGLVGLHSVPIVMNDLKPGNVLLDEDNEPHLTDFGLSKKLQSYAQGYTTHQGRGTLAYMAPEKLGMIDKSTDPTVTPKSDMWSFAATVVHMLTGKQPFLGLDFIEVVNKVAVSKQSPAVPADCDPQLRDLLQQCFAAEPTERPSAEAALQAVEELLRLHLFNQASNKDGNLTEHVAIEVSAMADSSLAGSICREVESILKLVDNGPNQAAKLSETCNDLLVMMELLIARKELEACVGPKLQLLLEDLQQASIALDQQQTRDQNRNQLLAERANDLQRRSDSLAAHIRSILELEADKQAPLALREMGIDIKDIKDDLERHQLLKLYIHPATISNPFDGNELGKGGCNKVYEATDYFRKEKVAVKVFEVGKTDDNTNQALHPMQELLSQELFFLMDAKLHALPQVCEYYGFTTLPSRGSEKCFGVVMKRYKGSLEKMVPKDGLPVIAALRYSVGILKGLVDVHSVPIVMNDLKPHNVLLDEDDEPFLGDFGISTKVQSYSQGYSTLLGRGTSAYMAPEKFGKLDSNDPRVNLKSDMWSFAATVVHMLTGKLPFQGMDHLKLVHHVGILKNSPAVPDNCNDYPQLQELLKECFAVDPSQRPSAAAALYTVEALLLSMQDQHNMVEST